MKINEIGIFCKQIDKFAFIYLNYISKNVIRMGKGKILPYRNAIIDLHKGSQIIIGDYDLEIGTNTLKGSKIETYVRLHKNAIWNAYGGCQIAYGSIIEVLDSARVDSGYFTMNSFCTLISKKHIKLGNDVMFSRKVVVFDSDFHDSMYDGKKNEMTAEVCIGDHVWISVNSCVLKGVTISDGAIIAANSLVCRDINHNSLIGCENNMKVIASNVEWRR